ncbi:ribosomal-processing cysteine protease Prp [Candidatus Epulonipiscium viviparus]|uniref:ribosomal-processing cysteine protease Prp n=1 Tax=Candidatus Epulonipiscium viviparus TaxID=420336 RepID=UPI00016BFDC3
MINIKLYFKEENLFRFRVSGHANYAKSGSDIVCAGVSALVFTAVNSIEAFLDEPMLINEKDEQQGIIDCTFPNIKNEIYNPQTTILLKSLSFGLEGIQKMYPANVRIKKYIPRR